MFMVDVPFEFVKGAITAQGTNDWMVLDKVDLLLLLACSSFDELADGA